MNVYIDCGAYNGDTLNCEKLFGFNADYKIAFEPNPNYHARLAKRRIDRLEKSVVWYENTTIKFSIDKSKTPMGSSVMKTKPQFNKGTKIQVPAIDFAEYITQFKDDVILVKMDIEGAEFKVLKHLIDTGTDQLIDKLYVETHENKIPEYTSKHAEDLIARLSCKVEKWL